MGAASHSVRSDCRGSRKTATGGSPRQAIMHSSPWAARPNKEKQTAAGNSEACWPVPLVQLPGKGALVADFRMFREHQHEPRPSNKWRILARFFLALRLTSPLIDLPVAVRPPKTNVESGAEETRTGFHKVVCRKDFRRTAKPRWHTIRHTCGNLPATRIGHKYTRRGVGIMPATDCCYSPTHVVAPK